MHPETEAPPGSAGLSAPPFWSRLGRAGVRLVLPRALLAAFCSGPAAQARCPPGFPLVRPSAGSSEGRCCLCLRGLLRRAVQDAAGKSPCLCRGHRRSTSAPTRGHRLPVCGSPCPPGRLDVPWRAPALPDWQPARPLPPPGWVPAFLCCPPTAQEDTPRAPDAACPVTEP